MVPTGCGRGHRMVPTYPHITIFVRHEQPIRDNYTGHGHFYVIFGRDNLPQRLARVSELRIVESAVN